MQQATVIDDLTADALYDFERRVQLLPKRSVIAAEISISTINAQVVFAAPVVQLR